MQIDRWIERQKNRQRDRQRDRKIDRQLDRQKDRQTDRKIDRQIERYIERQIVRQMIKLIDIIILSGIYRQRDCIDQGYVQIDVYVEYVVCTEIDRYTKEDIKIDNFDYTLYIQRSLT